MNRTALPASAAAVLVALLAGCAPRPSRNPSEPARTSAGSPGDVAPGVVDGATAARLAAAGARVVDVRTPQEFASGHVPGAVNVPFDEIARRAGELGAPGTPLVVYCRSGRRSAIAAEALRGVGYEQVWDAQRYDTWPRTGVAVR